MLEPDVGLGILETDEGLGACELLEPMDEAEPDGVLTSEGLLEGAGEEAKVEVGASLEAVDAT